ncbi:MAG: PSD1 and planctomycete cytochrome C domain-containing protein [Planctomycetota bacterium]
MQHSLPGPLQILFVSALLLTGAIGGAEETTNAQAIQEHVPHFESDVRPIFKAMCFHCHGEEEHPEGGLDLRLVRLMRQGGDSGDAIGETFVRGGVNESLIWERIESDEMPEGPQKLTSKEKAVIRRWLENGAGTLRPEPDDVDAAAFTLEELQHWAFQPIEMEGVRTAALSIDEFIANKLAAAGLVPSPLATPAVQLRRLHLTVTGMVPTEERLMDFVSQYSDERYQAEVDHLLSSTDYGIRLGRMWLDLVGYSESDGYLSDDRIREHAWRYRDYVIDSLNADLPYDQFVVEQIAGDELAILQGEGVVDPDDAQHRRWLTATGMLQMPIDLTERENTLANRNQAITDIVRIVSEVTFGLTMQCAQCHDHRYDPITHKDYYSLRAVFDPAFSIQTDRWRAPSSRVMDLTPTNDRRTNEVAAIAADKKRSELDKERKRVAQRIQAKLLDAVDSSEQRSLRLAISTPADKRTPEQRMLLKAHPMVKSIEQIAANMIVYDPDSHELFHDRQSQIDAELKRASTKVQVMATTEPDRDPPESVVFDRGDPNSPTEAVQPNHPFVVQRWLQTNIEERSRSLTRVESSSGRRLVFAKSLFEKSHPTVSRVIVNRLWQHLFGRGLVDTPDDFGLNGSRPNHPELLDSLAVQLIDHDWKLKPLLRSVLNSHTFRQSAQPSDAARQSDPDNRLLSHQNLLRLDAEQVRDSLLVVSGLLNRQTGGPSVPTAIDPEGKVVVGRAKLNSDGLQESIEDVGDQEYRRSVYLMNRRHRVEHTLHTWDMPTMSPNCSRRMRSTAAQQSLWFLNDPSLTELSEEWAHSLNGEPINDRNRIRSVFLGLFSEPPTAQEMKQTRTLLRRLRDYFRRWERELDWQERITKYPRVLENRALAAVIQALMSTNRFLYSP